MLLLKNQIKRIILNNMLTKDKLSKINFNSNKINKKTYKDIKKQLIVLFIDLKPSGRDFFLNEYYFTPGFLRILKSKLEGLKGCECSKKHPESFIDIIKGITLSNQYKNDYIKAIKRIFSERFIKNNDLLNGK